MEKNYKIAIFGASGLVGSRLCEILQEDRKIYFKALIHNAGNAFRIARFPINIESVNLLDRNSIKNGLKNCKIVVNCSRGDEYVMNAGFKNLVKESINAGIQKFIHISSVLIYGESPPNESETENCVPNPGKNEYGIIKLKQDEFLQKNKNKINSIVLCPPNIHGPYSNFSISVLNELKRGKVKIIQTGTNPCNIVYTDNLVYAIVNSLNAKVYGFERFFITDSGEPSWKEYLENLIKITGVRCELEKIENREDEKIEKKYNTSGSFNQTVRFISSKEFRSLLDVIPIFRRINRFVSYKINTMNPKTQEKIRSFLNKRNLNEKKMQKKSFLEDLQYRKIRHSIKKAEDLLGFVPKYDYNYAIKATKLWFEFNKLI